VLQHCYLAAAFSPVDGIWAVVIVLRIRRKIVRIVVWCTLYHNCAQWYAHIHTGEQLSSPVHTGNKVEFNAVDFVESRLLPKLAAIRHKVSCCHIRSTLLPIRATLLPVLATNRQQHEFDSLSWSTLLPIWSTLLPVCTTFHKVDRVEFDFVAGVYRALQMTVGLGVGLIFVSLCFSWLRRVCVFVYSLSLLHGSF